VANEHRTDYELRAAPAASLPSFGRPNPAQGPQVEILDRAVVVAEDKAPDEFGPATVSRPS